jgi:hypothetical protein
MELAKNLIKENQNITPTRRRRLRTDTGENLDISF